MKHYFTIPKNQKGFTLVETIVAIFILTMTIGALLTLTAGGFYSVRYARNQIVADYLAQESLEYIRNTRDTARIESVTWDDWKTTYNVNNGGQPVQGGSYNRGCFSEEGCTVDPYTIDPKIVECNGECSPILFYPDSGFYGYETRYPSDINTDNPVETTFVRTIAMQESENSPDQVIVTVTVSWLNGTHPKTVRQSTLITNWQP